MIYSRVPKKLTGSIIFRFKALSDDSFLSLSWLSELLEALVDCHQDFKDVVSKHTADFIKPPLDKLVNEFSDRSIKALDICNVLLSVTGLRRFGVHITVGDFFR
ncbi:hypothetical protein L1987_85492 [Smallanthus sonchifolius]|uniref:Uncharacterized protein n=1 Tax=Smallanthus sonchifolius TaxID=185202 RepID=A0ACB8XXA8_9ASTR|nr:hypothetical protein L1987_85492 [Smallanthus sonchifolius]